MTKVRMVFAALLALFVTAAPLLAAPCEKADAGLAGRYQLTGVMETGSIIVLAADGRFGYMLTVGAYDEVAEGCWRRDGGSVLLEPTKILANDGAPSFKRLKLDIDASGGLVRYHQGKKYGVYERLRK